MSAGTPTGASRSRVAHRRCLNHPGREAAARCVRCRNYFCRECATEHSGRLICSGCLAVLHSTGETRRSGAVWLARSLQLLAGLFLVWSCFTFMGKALLLIPSSFHEGEVWEDLWRVDR